MTNRENRSSKFDPIPSLPVKMTTEVRNLLETPAKFSFAPAEWPKWRKRFERYRIAASLDKQCDLVQINTLLYVMGDNAEDIFDSFKWLAKADNSPNPMLSVMKK